MERYCCKDGVSAALAFSFFCDMILVFLLCNTAQRLKYNGHISDSSHFIKQEDNGSFPDN